MHGLEEGKAAMTDEEGRVGGEVEAGTADWRVRVGPRNKLTAREGKNTMQHTCRSVTGAHTARWAEVVLITTCRRKEVRTCRGDQ